MGRDTVVRVGGAPLGRTGAAGIRRCATLSAPGTAEGIEPNPALHLTPPAAL
ncbi:hypothetical protein [Gemmata obscuriglobus]|uniref:hypothetical protein n=1 Tax=Gemmata obscuriglobus TaxID=114 RepID=UPI001E5ABB55|nr:hypothetical protein [Gemmata obscuriglobus]